LVDDVQKEESQREWGPGGAGEKKKKDGREREHIKLHYWSKASQAVKTVERKAVQKGGGDVEGRERRQWKSTQGEDPMKSR